MGELDDSCMREQRPIFLLSAYSQRSHAQRRYVVIVDPLCVNGTDDSFYMSEFTLNMRA